MNKPDIYHSFNKAKHNISVSALLEYSNKIKWNRIEDTAIDIGCGEGSNSVIIKNISPCIYKKFVASDISEEMINFANKRYADEGISFRVMDMVGEIPRDLKCAFNHVFSFYALHWARNQEKLFKNIYDLMSDEGDCFLIFVGSAAIHSAYEALRHHSKWKSWLKRDEPFMSPYHGMKDPDRKVAEIMTKCGFNNIDIECKRIINNYKSIQEVRALVHSIEPFNMPHHVMDDFIQDYMKVSQELGIIHVENQDTEDVFVSEDLLIIVYATK